MEKIKAIYFSYLRAEAHYEYLTQFKTMLDTWSLVKTVVANQYDDFVARLNREGELLNEMRKSDYTAQIAEADQRVDRDLVGINATVTAALHHFNHDVVLAAQSLHNRLQAFGEIGAKSYEEETAAVNLLLADLASPEYATKVAIVELTPWVAELTDAEAAFEKLLFQRYEEASAKVQGRLVDARRDTEAAYRPITDRIVAAVLMSDDPELLKFLQGFIAELNVIITYFNDHNHRPAKKDLGEGDHCVIEPIEEQPYVENRPATPVPVVHWREDGKETVRLSLGKDFSVTYKNNTNVGMAELTIHGKGEYKGTKTTTFMIAR
jgi:hypothetical protein